MILVLPDKDASISSMTNRPNMDLMYKEMRVRQAIVKFPKFRVKNKLPMEDILKHVRWMRETSSVDLSPMHTDREIGDLVNLQTT